MFSAFASFVLLRLFYTSNSVVIVDVKAQEYFLPQGAGYTSFATASGCTRLRTQALAAHQHTFSTN